MLLRRTLLAVAASFALASAAHAEATNPRVVINTSLGSITLGGIRPSTLARAGEVDEQTAGAIAVADRFFATERVPHNFTWF